jgi:hypothetical protein
MPDGSTEIANARARRIEAIGHLAVTRKVHTLPIGLATRRKLDGRLESPGRVRDFGQITMRVPVGSNPSLRHSWFTEIILGNPGGLR